MFKFIGILILLLVQVNEVVSDPVQVTDIHGPRDPEGVTRDVVDLNAVWCG